VAVKECGSAKGGGGSVSGLASDNAANGVCGRSASGGRHTHGPQSLCSTGYTTLYIGLAGLRLGPAMQGTELKYV
jgi:hypothetical protein